MSIDHDAASRAPADEVPFPQFELERLQQRKWILEYAPRHAAGAEIGVFRGHFSAVLARQLKPRILYLVDPWTKLGESFGWGKETEYTGFGRLTTKYAYDDTCRRIAPYRDKTDIRVTEAFANEFLAQLAHPLDWVYLDASHAYAATLAELNMLDKAISGQGVIMGDDWQPSPEHKDYGVYLAVQEFTRSGAWEIIAAGPAGQWCIRRRSSHWQLKIVPCPDAGATGAVLLKRLDVVPSVVEATRPITLGGIVVLDRDSPGEHALVARDRNGLHPVEWHQTSPSAAKRFPDNPRAAKARFRVEGLEITPTDPVDILLTGPGEAHEPVFRVEMHMR